MVHGPRAGLGLLETLDEPLGNHHRLAAVRAHLLEMAGDEVGAGTAYERAARLTTSIPERRYLEARMAALQHLDPKTKRSGPPTEGRVEQG
jgi:predicted RNA polymerase sigma factor